MWQAVSGSANSNDVISARKTPLAQRFSGASSFPLGGNMPDMTTGSLTVAGKAGECHPGLHGARKEKPREGVGGHGGASYMSDTAGGQPSGIVIIAPGASACHQR
jgi:hypothetical protein